MLIVVLLIICCSLPLCIMLTPLMCGENLTRPVPKVGESRADLRLPFYTSGFE